MLKGFFQSVHLHSELFLMDVYNIQVEHCESVFFPSVVRVGTSETETVFLG